MFSPHPRVSHPTHLRAQYDQDELLAELEELEQLELDEQLLNMESVPASRLPNVPTTTRMLPVPQPRTEGAELGLISVVLLMPTVI
jgi:hypothetical protein